MVVVPAAVFADHARVVEPATARPRGHPAADAARNSAPARFVITVAVAA